MKIEELPFYKNKYIKNIENKAIKYYYLIVVLNNSIHQFSPNEEYDDFISKLYYYLDSSIVNIDYIDKNLLIEHFYIYIYKKEIFHSGEIEQILFDLIKQTTFIKAESIIRKEINLFFNYLDISKYNKNIEIDIAQNIRFLNFDIESPFELHIKTIIMSNNNSSISGILYNNFRKELDLMCYNFMEEFNKNKKSK